MLYFALAMFALCSWILPWWCLSITALMMGLFFQPSKRRSMEITTAAGAVWAALAWIYDGHHHLLISARMSGLFNLPFPPLMYAIMAMVGGLTALLSYLTGVSVARIFGPVLTVKEGPSAPENA